MARAVGVLLVVLALAPAVGAVEVHPTERDQILQMVSALGSTTRPASKLPARRCSPRGTRPSRS